MSARFRAVQWNRAKLVYDGILLASIALYIGTYLMLAYWLDPPKDQPATIDLCIRAFGSCAFLMLTIILSIGPLTRLDRHFLPLLYNRRHFGVLTLSSNHDHRNQRRCNERARTDRCPVGCGGRRI
jgi:hypothetical protein